MKTEEELINEKTEFGGKAITKEELVEIIHKYHNQFTEDMAYESEDNKKALEINRLMSVANLTDEEIEQASVEIMGVPDVGFDKGVQWLRDQLNKK